MKTKYFTLTDDTGRTIAIIGNIDNDKFDFNKAILTAALEDYVADKAEIAGVWLNPSNFSQSSEITVNLFEDDELVNEQAITVEPVLMYGGDEPKAITETDSPEDKGYFIDSFTGEKIFEAFVFPMLEGAIYIREEEAALIFAGSHGYEDLEESYKDDFHYWTSVA